jgi:predicted solute-binding protein
MSTIGAASRGSTARRLRIGYFEDLTTRILTYGIDKAISSAGTRRGTVSDVRAWLDAGEVDVALLPAWDFLQLDRLDLIPGAAFSTTGPGNIMLLCSKVLPTEIRRVLVDHESFGARSLLEILLPSQTGVRPDVTRAAEPLDPARLDIEQAPFDAFLFVGDNALRVKRSAFAWVWDLGAAWQGQMQSPLVIHVWCCRKGVFLRGLDAELAVMARSNLKGVAEIAARDAERLGANPEILNRLLAGVFRWEGGPLQITALRLYVRELSKVRLLQKPRQFALYQEHMTTASSTRVPKL